jgi:hypothetical protein
MAKKPRATHEELSKAVERERKRATVRSLDLSFNELADMYKTGEIHIAPAYQRLFRWSEAKQSQFIESIILEMPIPPIYAVEMGEAQWELIDGLQRLSTYLHFKGELQLPGENPDIKFGELLELTACDIVPALNGLKFSDLTTSLQHRVRRATLRVDVVRREGNPRFAYHMFKRLNTGGEPLSNQEIRNCSIRLLGTRFVDFATKIAKDPKFQLCIEDITDEFRLRMGEDELVLRFFAFKNNLDEYVHDIDPFLTDYLERVTDQEAEDSLPFDYAQEERIFRKTFKVLADTIGARAFSRWVDGKFAGGFSIAHYEAFSIGLATIIDKVSDAPEAAELGKIGDAMLVAKSHSDLRQLTVGGGKNFRRIYERKIALVADSLRAIYG